MRTRILTVDDTFSIQNWGPTIVGRMTNDFVDLKIGYSIGIESDDGRTLYSKIVSIPFVCKRYSDENPETFDDCLISFCVESEIKIEKISKGANIWLLDNAV